MGLVTVELKRARASGLLAVHDVPPTVFSSFSDTMMHEALSAVQTPRLPPEQARPCSLRTSALRLEDLRMLPFEKPFPRRAAVLMVNRYAPAADRLEEVDPDGLRRRGVP
jgi:hypothetical protein